jgi:hypothetical protein
VLFWGGMILFFAYCYFAGKSTWDKMTPQQKYREEMETERQWQELNRR